VHQYIGEEAIATGVCANLTAADYVFSNHRGHGHSIAKGADPTAMMKELFGRVGGTSGGKGGSMHIADFSVGMLGANGVLPDGLTMALGAAHTVRLRGDDAIVCAFVGDGTTNRGPFYEALNWSKVFELPILFVCEDNTYASSTRTARVTAGAGPAARASAFAIPAISIDGNDRVTVDATAADLVGRIRAGSGPQFLHARTYRIKGHVSRDRMLYRTTGETAAAWQAEPIGRTATWLGENGVDESALAAARDNAATIIAAALDAAHAAPEPDAALAWVDVQDVGAPIPRTAS
jgi:TPP-dependent pyruvate/acetoin dehydrogenase alpha subunit